MAPDSSRPATRSSRREVSGLPAFSRAEVAAHSTPSDCWVVVRGKVYNVTEW
jgi:cytochrome b involved in lipid metabolism